MATSAVEFSIVLPAHNEAGNIAPIIAELKRLTSTLGRTEIIGVDDGSDDATLDALRAAAAVEAAAAFSTPLRPLSGWTLTGRPRPRSARPRLRRS